MITWKQCIFITTARPGTASSTGGELSMKDFDDDDNDGLGGGYRAGGGPSSNSRARMLAQQRELQLKKRQSNMQSGGKNIYPVINYFRFLFSKRLYYIIWDIWVIDKNKTSTV